ncbi:RHS repeat-associated core domain-containing protein [Streptomyces sp. NBC_00090]|uniref:RHS repeat-associated core domain-containing protein n=1 Tax=Streptomyces sp. NBC_00090 TaxID=2903619 RepID=UPI003865C70C
MQDLTWNEEGKLKTSTISGRTTSFLYDAEGTRIIKRDPAKTTLYLPGGQELELTRKAGTTPAAISNGTRYYSVPGGSVIRTSKDNSVRILVSDHHNTNTLSISASSLAVNRRKTMPFGGQRGAAPYFWPGTKRFVGGDIDSTTGFTHVGAREYDTTLGQFISVDPLLEIDKPQTVNGYGYAGNSPVTFSDPTGTCMDAGNGHCEDDTAWTPDDNIKDDGGQETFPSSDGGSGSDGTNSGNSGNGNSSGSSSGCHYAMGMNYCESGGPADSSGSNPAPGPQVNYGTGYPVAPGMGQGCTSGWQCGLVYTVAFASLAVVIAPLCAALPSGCAQAVIDEIIANEIGAPIARPGLRAPISPADTRATSETLRAVVANLHAKSIVSKHKTALAGALQLDGGEQQVLLASSGVHTPANFVPMVGDAGNPARFKAVSTGKNARQNETEYKMLTYIANQIGAPSDVRGSLVMHSSRQACTSCTGVLGQFMDQFPNIRITYTSGQ